jgi:ATP-binding cassette, subfamily B, bacterial
MADQIIVMDGGRVVESGDHQALMGRGGIYAELFNVQAEGYQP